MKLPQIGSKVRITTDWSQYKAGFAAYLPRMSVTEGVVVEPESWEYNDVIAVATGNPSFPVSSVPINRITNIEYLDGAESQRERKDVLNTAKVYQIPGSKGTTYTVTIDGKNHSCTCVAGQFGRSCKHVKQALELIQQEQ